MNLDKKFDIIIIGSGLGGLVSGALLAKEGMSVLILEKGNKFGGLLHTFRREERVFNTGMNYIGSLEKGGFLEQYFRYLGIMDELDIKRLDMNAYEEISFGADKKTFKYAQTQSGFIENLTKDFPQYHLQIQEYVDKIWKVSNHFPLLFPENYDQIVKGNDYLNGSIWKFIKSLNISSKLESVLSATNSLYGGTKEKTPLYVHALVNRQFINSAWRFVNGSQQLANALRSKIENAGGALLNKSKVVKIQPISEDEMKLVCEDGRVYRAGKVISNISPSRSLQMLDDKRIKTVYKKRITELKNTPAFFNLYLIFKPESFPYLNRNYYHFKTEEVWGHEKPGKNWPGYFIFYTGLESHNQKYAYHATALTYMDYSEVALWEGSIKGNRGDDYESFKEKKAQELIQLLEEKFPRIKNSIQSYYAATPLTYEHYVGTPNGSAYGIEKDFNYPYKTIISPNTKIPNLLFTGQNLNMHGALGVTIGAVLTSSEILGFDYLLGKIRKEVV